MKELFKNEILRKIKSINTETLVSKDIMTIIIESYKFKLKKKDISFHCLVLNHDYEDKDKNKDKDATEIQLFLQFLEKHKKKLPNSRFQFLCKLDGHWLTVDCQIQENQLKFFIIDAANLRNHSIQLMMQIEKYCPDSRIICTVGLIQYDSSSCSFFGINHATSLAKIPDLHCKMQSSLDYNEQNHTYQEQCLKLYSKDIWENIEKNFDKEQIESVAKLLKKLQYIMIEDLPLETGSLLKNIQNIQKFIDSFIKKAFKLNSSKTLSAHIQANYKYQEGKERNMSIHHKRDKIKITASTFVEDKDDTYLYEIINRSPINFFQSTIFKEKNDTLLPNPNSNP